MSDVFYFLQGYARVVLFKLRLLPCKVRDEYVQRIGLSSECVENRECLACGCRAPAVMMADKACQAPKYLDETACYPQMGALSKSKMKISPDWKNQIIDLGQIVKGKSYYATFFYTGDKKIKDVSVSCGCTTPSITPDAVTLKLSYSIFSGPLAKKINKFATVHFEDGSTEMLQIIGKG